MYFLLLKPVFHFVTLTNKWDHWNIFEDGINGFAEDGKDENASFSSCCCNAEDSGRIDLNMLNADCYSR